MRPNERQTALSKVADLGETVTKMQDQLTYGDPSATDLRRLAETAKSEAQRVISYTRAVDRRAKKAIAAANVEIVKA